MFVALAGLLIVPLFAGCDAVAPEVKTLQQQVAALVEWKATAQADINTAKSTAGSLSGQVSSATSDVNSLRSQINSMGPNTSYTKAEVDAKIAAATTAANAAIDTKIAAHLAATGSGSGSGTGTGGTGGSGSTISDVAVLLSSDQSIELWLEWVDPNKNLNDYETRFANEVEFQFAVKNKDTATHKYSIELRLTPEEHTVVTLPPTYISTTLGTWDITQNSTTHVVTMMTATEGRISRETTDKYNFRLELDQTPSVYWKVKAYISQED